MKFINIKAILIVCATIILPQGLTAETIIMDCEGTYFKYSKSFWSNAKVTVRLDAEWQPWCEGEIKFSDKGAKCNYEIKENIGKIKYNYIRINKKTIKYARENLSERHSYCKKNKEDFDCRPKTDNLGFCVGCGEQKPSYTFDCLFCNESSCSKFQTTHEKKNFYDLPTNVYVEMHLPKLGAKACQSSSEFVVSKQTNKNVTSTLDFFLLTENYYKMRSNRDGSGHMKKSRCTLIN